jgi:hypothetical protein
MVNADIGKIAAVIVTLFCIGMIFSRFWPILVRYLCRDIKMTEDKMTEENRLVMELIVFAAGFCLTMGIALAILYFINTFSQ